MKLFLSYVSGEFKSYRLKLANHLAASRGGSFEVKVQEDFQQGGFTLQEQLADYIRDCDLVVHLLGDARGARPEPELVRALLRSLGETPSEPLPAWSYAHWEDHLARRFGKRMLVYVAKPDAPGDQGLPVQQSADDARLQQAHRDHIFRSGEHYKEFASPTNLVREVFYDLGLNPESIKVNNQPFKTLGSLFKGREGFLRQIRETLGRVDHRGHERFTAITASASAATVHGLDGIGKTRAAIEYAHRHADEFTALLFVRADSEASLQQNLASLCGSLVLELPEKEARETEVQVAAVMRWLQQHPGWFLIVDNVDTEEAAQAVENLLSQLSSAGAGAGHVAIEWLVGRGGIARPRRNGGGRRKGVPAGANGRAAAETGRRSRAGTTLGGRTRVVGSGTGTGRGLHREAPTHLREIPRPVAE
jgi:AAA domain